MTKDEEIAELKQSLAQAKQKKTLRDEFAMAALTSMLSPVQDIKDTTYARAAELSYKFADAMMKERHK